MRGFFAIATLVVGGIMLADLLIHPEGVKALAGGSQKIIGTTSSALLGGAPVQQR